MTSPISPFDRFLADNHIAGYWIEPLGGPRDRHRIIVQHERNKLAVSFQGGRQLTKFALRKLDYAIRERAA
jgi:hypothetical protein